MPLVTRRRRPSGWRRLVQAIRRMLHPRRRRALRVREWPLKPLSVHRPRPRKGRQPVPRGVKQRVFERDRGRCVQCGSRGDLQFDHVIPVSWGGATTEENLQVLCRSCNLRKGARYI